MAQIDLFKSVDNQQATCLTYCPSRVPDVNTTSLPQRLNCFLITTEARQNKAPKIICQVAWTISKASFLSQRPFFNGRSQQPNATRVEVSVCLFVVIQGQMFGQVKRTDVRLVWPFKRASIEFWEGFPCIWTVLNGCSNILEFGISLSLWQDFGICPLPGHILGI